MKSKKQIKKGERPWFPSIAAMIILLSVIAFHVHAFDIYMSPDGDDKANGTTIKTAVKTLDAVKARYKELSKKKPDESVNIFFAPGKYVGQGVVWDIPKNKGEITIQPLKPEDKVIFDGESSDGEFFILRTNARVIIKNIELNNYCEGISLGDYKSGIVSNQNRIENVTFKNIGSKYDPVTKVVGGRKLNNGNCVAAIRIQRSKENEIINCKFFNIENLPEKQTAVQKYGPLLLHSIYLSDGASGNTIEDNEFNGFTGSPIRLRNNSDNNKIRTNKFKRPIYVKTKGDYKIKAISQWYCNDKAPGCAAKMNPECPSVGTSIKTKRHPNEAESDYKDSNVEWYADESQSKKSTCREQKSGKEVTIE